MSAATYTKTVQCTKCKEPVNVWFSSSKNRKGERLCELCFDAHEKQKNQRTMINLIVILSYGVLAGWLLVLLASLVSYVLQNQ